MKNKSLGLLLGAVAGLMLIPPVFSVPAPVRMEQSYSNGGGVGSTPLAKPEAAIQVRLDQAYGKLPLSFEANQGQTDGRVKFLARTGGSTLFLTSTEAVLVLTKSEARAKRDRFRGPTPDLTQRQKTSRTVVRMTLVGANPQPQVAGLEEFPGNVNYFIGNDPTKWRTNVPTYAKVEYRDVYPGVNLVYYGNQRKLEYDFVVAPGADPGAIRLAFEGVDNLTLDTQGNLILHTVGGEIRQQVPIVYQESNGARREISGRYVLQGKDGVGFQVAAYDRTKPLVIDPVLVYSTYLGGSGFDGGLGIALDASGNAYVTGEISSIDFPTANPIQATFGGGSNDAFMAKLNAAGSALVYSTYLGGSGDDVTTGIAVDGAGNAYVTGITSSTDFPTVNPLQAAFGGGVFDGFVAKFNATGTALVYSTYLGGSSAAFTAGDAGLGIAVDGAGNAYVTGRTPSADFPTVNPLQATFGGGDADAFMAKLNAAGSALVYSTYLGGSGFEQVFGGIAVDAAGNAYVTGSTTSADFPTANPIQATLTGVEDAFVAKLNAAGLALVYSTYLGGSGFNEPVGIAVDGAGNAYVTGITSSTDFPTVNPLQATFGGGDHDAFVAKLNPSIPSVNTPSGSNVAVPLGSGVAVTFPSVSSQGNTTVTTSSTGPTPPAGFSLGMPPTYYDITTTGAFTAPVNVCIRYDPEQFSDPENPQNLRLLHFEGSAWVDVTTSNDTVNFRICGQVSSFSPFVIAESPVMGVSIDIKPGSFPNTINLGSGGTVPVAIFSTASFDARTVDPLTVTLASAPVKLKGKGTPMASFEDVNGDGLLDLVVHVETTALQLSASDTVAVLEGQTTGGTMIRGNDSVRVVP